MGEGQEQRGFQYLFLIISGTSPWRDQAWQGQMISGERALVLTLAQRPVSTQPLHD